MKEKQIDTFEKVINQLDGMHSEVSLLSKKSYTDAINIFKLNMVNQVLEEANTILGSDYKPFKDFDIFDTENIPNNSDVTLVLSQYLNCMESLREKNIFSEVEWSSSGNIAKTYWYWNKTKRETYPPKNIKK